MVGRILIALCFLVVILASRDARAEATTTVRLPDGECRDVYDVLLHLHGRDPLVLDGVAAAGIDAAVVVANRGVDTTDYLRAFASESSLDAMLGLVRRRFRERGCDSRVGRIALSVWSAGSGGAFHLLSDASERFDAFVAMDAPYASYLGASGGPISPPTLRPFLRYARRAARGAVMMAVSHSQIRTPGYASARETTSAILRALGMTREASPKDIEARHSEPVLTAFGGPPPTLHRLSIAEQGGLSIASFAGRDAEAHVAHLTHAPRIVWKRLAERWAAPAAETERTEPPRS